MVKKRTRVVCLVFALVAGAFVAPADAGKRESKKVTREAVDTYGLPWTSTPSTGEGCFGNGCVRFRISGSERWATIEVSDESGTPTAFKVAQKTDRGRAAETMGGPFCGSSGEKSVRLVPGAEVFVYVYGFGDVDCPGSVGTTGSVKAVFSNLP